SVLKPPLKCGHSWCVRTDEGHAGGDRNGLAKTLVPDRARHPLDGNGRDGHRRLRVLRGGDPAAEGGGEAGTSAPFHDGGPARAPRRAAPELIEAPAEAGDSMQRRSRPDLEAAHRTGEKCFALTARTPHLERMDRAERAGVWAGWLLAPLTGTLSLLRRARMFHPEGAVYRARVETVPGPYAMLGRRLEGPALARLSTAWWRSGKEWLDALGIAIRVGRDPGAEAKRGDQDLLFATIRSPWTTPFAPLTTEQHDFLANDYYGVSPFEVA